MLGAVEYFARNLRALAGLHGLTGGGLAAVLGLSRPAVSDLLTGKRQPSLQTVLRIRDVFDIGSSLVSEPLEAILPRLADTARYRYTLEQLARLEGDDSTTIQVQRHAEVELFALRRRRGTVQPSTKRGER